MNLDLFATIKRLCDGYMAERLRKDVSVRDGLGLACKGRAIKVHTFPTMNHKIPNV